MRVALTGVNGFVGGKIKQAYPDYIDLGSLRDMSADQIKRIVDKAEPDVIIHTAAIADIPTCEEDIFASYRANVMLPLYLAQTGARIIAFSSDQVYIGANSQTPSKESEVCPDNLYGRQKLEMETRIMEVSSDNVALRAQWMYDSTSYKGNFYLNLMNAQGSVTYGKGCYRCVTWMGEILENIPQILALPGGVYNFGSEADKPLYDVVEEFIGYTGLQLELKEGTPSRNLWMDCSKARENGLKFSSVSEALKRCYEADLNRH